MSGEPRCTFCVRLKTRALRTPGEDRKRENQLLRAGRRSAPPAPRGRTPATGFPSTFPEFPWPKAAKSRAQSGSLPLPELSWEDAEKTRGRGCDGAVLCPRSSKSHLRRSVGSWYSPFPAARLELAERLSPGGGVTAERQLQQQRQTCRLHPEICDGSCSTRAPT